MNCRRCLLRAGALVCGLGLGLVPPAAHAGRDDDHERARSALRTGDALPLAAVLDRLQRSHPGQVLEVELEREDSGWVYEIKLLQSGGTLLKLEVDARSGTVLRERRKSAERRREPGDARPRGADDDRKPEKPR